MVATLLAMVTEHCCDNNTVDDGDNVAVGMTLVLVVVSVAVVTPILLVTMTIDSKGDTDDILLPTIT